MPTKIRDLDLFCNDCTSVDLSRSDFEYVLTTVLSLDMCNFTMEMDH